MEDFSKWPTLARVNDPADVKALDAKELPALASEIRDYLVFRVGENGGHLASNLGVVELTLALTRVFSAPRDHILFDVGHQSYVYKLLTARKDRFDTLRCAGGIAGFQKREESVFDAFGAGHASTAISAAIGMAEAEALSGSDAYTVAVVGDGALSGGLSYEGLNNCRRSLRLIIVINENDMSISPNTGRLARHLSRLRGSRNYLKTKAFTISAVRHIPLLGRPLYKGIRRIKRAMHHMVYHENLFEHMGIKYMGPVDGNDLEDMIACLEYAKKLDQSVILHVKTQKGKGYAPAEQDPNAYHGLAPRTAAAKGETFSQRFGNALCAIGKSNTAVCAITAAMCDGTGLVPFRAAYPRRFFDVGIAEEHAVTFAAGLAAGGKRPVVALYSTFLQRAYDQIVHDVALQRLPVVFAVDRAGFNLRDGATHHGVLDVAMFAAINGFSLYAPVTLAGVERALHAALAQKACPAALRYPCGEENAAIRDAFFGNDDDPAAAPRVRIWQNDATPRLIIVTHGRIAVEALHAAERLRAQGITAGILLCEQLLPFADAAAALAPHLTGTPLLFLEEEVRAGGFGLHLAEQLHTMGKLPENYTVMGANDVFCTPRAGETVFAAAGVDAAAIVRAANRMIGREDAKKC